MAAKRKSISKSVRFEVFKRDKFSCQYCGKQAPDVVLVIDHIHPVSKGGENTLLNFATSCEDCNAGKGARTLADDSIVTRQRTEIKRLAERREQVQMMLEWHKLLAEEKNFELNAFAEQWASHTNSHYSLTETGLASVKKWLTKFSLNDLLSAATIAATQYFQIDKDGKPSHDSVNAGFSKVPGIARICKLPPAEKDLYYIRGILRKRLNYVNEDYAMELLREMHACGFDIEYLKSHARQVRNWTQWQDDVHRWLKEDQKDARS